MGPRTHVTFEWDTPDDGEFDDKGNVITPGGQRIAETIRSQLLAQGFQTTAPRNEEDYGWAFNATANGVPVWCLLQFADPWLFLTHVHLRSIHWLRGRKPTQAQARVCTAVHDVLVTSGRARSVRWFGREEFQTSKGEGGAPRP
jgi:hypothetical protein